MVLSNGLNITKPEKPDIALHAVCMLSSLILLLFLFCIFRVCILCGLLMLATLLKLFTSNYWKQSITGHLHIASGYQQRETTGYLGPKCDPKMHVAFIKIHKAASTTITSILQRYGLLNNLTFALPRKSNWWISLFETVNQNNVLPVKDVKRYDILCQHVVYNREAFAKILPPDTTTIASIREPFQRFLSSFLFFKEYRYTVIRNSKAKATDIVTMLRIYLNDPHRYEPSVFNRGSIALNRISFSLGLSPAQYTNKIYVEEYINILDKNITLVLIVELLDECLVLLKRRMCWSIKDILYRWHFKGPPKPWVPPDIQELHQQLAPSEYRLYEHFHTKITKELESQGNDFWEETNFFKSCLKRVQKFCKTQVNDTNAKLIFAASDFEEKFVFTRYDCKYLRMSETKFIKLLRRRQLVASVVDEKQLE